MNTPSSALAYPRYEEDVAICLAGLEEVRAGKRAVEVRIGVGPIAGPIPARVLGYAASVRRVLNDELGLVTGGTPHRLHLFSSAPKSEELQSETPVQALVALGGALRMAGTVEPITIENASSATEVPPGLNIEMKRSLFTWLEARTDAHGSGGPARFRYAVEHAADSMFGDLPAEPSEVPFRVTVGGTTEGRFFAVRCCVRRAALLAGLQVAPCAAFVLKAVRRPWYQPTAMEPALAAMTSPDLALAAMDAAANPTRGGNPGLKSEARALKRFVTHSLLGTIMEAARSRDTAFQFAEVFNLSIGPRLAAASKGESWPR